MFLQRYTQGDRQRSGYSFNIYLTMTVGLVLISFLACSVQSLERSDNTVSEKMVHDAFGIDADHFDSTKKIMKGIVDEGGVDSEDPLVSSDLPNHLSLNVDESLQIQGPRRLVEDFQEVESNYTFCNDVHFIMGTGKNDVTGEFYDLNVFACTLEEEPSRYVELSNLPSNFETEWKVARNLGKTSIAIIGETTLDGHTLILPDSASSRHVYQFLHPTSSLNESRTRNLAVNQLGTRSVIVFRVSINFGSESYNSLIDATETSNVLFGDGFSMKSQYAACSYEKVGFEPANLSGADAAGVVSITVNDPSTMKYEDIVEAVNLKAETSISGNGLGLNLDDYGHIMYALPEGAIYKDRTSWIAFALTVCSEISVFVHEFYHLCVTHIITISVIFCSLGKDHITTNRTLHSCLL